MDTADVASELPPELRVNRGAFARWMRTFTLPRLVPNVLHGVERLPTGGVLLVGNHGPLALDTPMLIHAIYRDTGRVVRSLSDRMVFSNPLSRWSAVGMGAVE